MKNLNNLTVVIVTYKTTEKIILDCLNSISPNVKVIIIENSKTFIHEKLVSSNFANVEVNCSGSNLGYGGGNKYGLKLVKTNNALILNPDVICNKDFFDNIVHVMNETNNFALIGCQNENDKIFMPAGFFDKNKNIKFKMNFKTNNIESLSKVDWSIVFLS